MTDRHPAILLVSTSYPLRPDSVSGVFVQRLAQALSRHTDVRVLAPGDAEQLASGALTPPVKTFRYAATSLQTLAHRHGGIPAALAQHPLKLLLVPPFLASMLVSCVLEGRKHDVLCANWSITGVVAGLAGKFLGRPVITVLRGEDANRAHQPGTHRFLLLACLKLSSRVVTVSDGIACRLAQYFPEHAHKVRLIPNGVEDAFLSIQAPSATISPSRMLFVGSLIPRKSVDTAIEAMTHLPSSVVLTVVGDGPERDRLQALSRAHNLGERVRFLGQHQHERLPGLFAEHDLLVLPSRGEGRANVILEAFAAARPVVASDIDGNRELVGNDERGRLFPAGDAHALAKSIIDLMRKECYLATATRARAFIISERLSWDHCAMQYLELINEISAD